MKKNILVYRFPIVQCLVMAFPAILATAIGLRYASCRCPANKQNQDGELSRRASKLNMQLAPLIVTLTIKSGNFAYHELLIRSFRQRRCGTPSREERLPAAALIAWYRLNTKHLRSTVRTQVSFDTALQVFMQHTSASKLCLNPSLSCNHTFYSGFGTQD